jgi:hypothetical protein
MTWMVPFKLLRRLEGYTESGMVTLDRQKLPAPTAKKVGTRVMLKSSFEEQSDEDGQNLISTPESECEVDVATGLPSGLNSIREFEKSLSPPQGAVAWVSWLDPREVG